MKALLAVAIATCMVGLAQQPDPTVNDPTVMALTSLLPLRQQAKFGEFLQASKQQSQFAEFLQASEQQSQFAEFIKTQSQFATLSNRDALLYVRARSQRPNYGGNAAAKTYKNLWLALIEGRTKLPTVANPPTP